MIEKLKNHIPEKVLNELIPVVNRYNLTPLMLSHFLAQCAHESNDFKVVVENLNYSAEGLMKTFRKYFSTVNPNDFAHKPEIIANRVYANRLGNGNESSGDGWRYRGRGYIQLTGKANYRDFFKSIQLPEDSNPELVATLYPMESAAYFFSKKDLWELCEGGSSKQTVTAITQRVNGGEIGLMDRVEKFNKFWSLLNG